MASANVELHLSHIDAFNARDIEALIGGSDPGVAIHSTFAAVGGAVYNGHNGLRRWLRDTQEIWDEIRVEAVAYIDLGDQTLLFNAMHGRGRQSGAEVEMPVAHVARWRNGLGVYYKSYAHREDALNDLSVTQGQLQPIAL